MPLVSVIVPVYKVEAYLHRCVDSILNQSYSELELILVDDGSPDRCGEICEEYASRDNRVHVIHQENGGLSAARNAGIDWMMAHSDAQWLTFIDSDDWIHRDYLKILMGMIQQDNTHLAMCLLKRTDAQEDDVLFETPRCMILTAKKDYSRFPNTTACCKVYHKTLWKDLRFPTGKLYEDAFVTHFTWVEADRISHCQEALYYYYCNPGSISRVKWTPRRLDQIEAHECRLEYWKQIGYEDCYNREMVDYVQAIGAQVLELQQMDAVSAEPHLTILRKKLRNELKAGRARGLLPFEEEYWGEYTLAYPNRMIRIALYFWLKLRKKLK